MTFLAIFDFDGTITRGDSLFRFIRFTHGPIATAFGLILLSPVLFLYVIKILPNWVTKEIVLKFCYGGWEVNRFNTLAQKFAKEDLDNIIKSSAMQKIVWHKEEGHKVVVVSASIENYLKPWCEKNGLEVLGTHLDVKDNKVTGKILGKNCHGQEKVRRIKEKYNLESFEKIFVYGDTSGDLALKEIATEFYYRNFS